MRHLLVFVMGSLLSAGALACDQEPAKLPDSMVCVESLCVSGKCQENSILFEDLKTKSPTAFYELESFSRDAVVQQSCDNDKVKLASNDGEQIDEIVLVRKDVRQLQEGRKGTINGIRETGYWYADGDHTDSVSVVECMVVD